MRGPAIPLIVSAIVVAALVLLLQNGGRDTSDGGELMVYCAAGIKPPVEEAANAFSEEFGVTIQLNYGGSGTLLSNLKVSNTGDIYIAADSSYTDLAREAGIVQEALPVAKQTPILAVPKGNPKNITGISDILDQQLRLAFANPDAASVGKTTKKLLTQQGLWDTVNDLVSKHGVFKPTVNEVATDVKLGTVDAGVIWDATAAQFPELEIIPIAGADAFTKNVTIGVLKNSEQSTLALKFARYLSAPEKGIPIFEKHGFEITPGDPWAERPELLYYSGGVNRIAIENTLAAFQAREGVDITTVYNGCGILLGQIKGGGRPDVYHTCDASFMKGVESLFTVPIDISKTDIVILVPKGNPKGIKDLNDLATMELQLGLCNEEQSTLGTMTAILLNNLGIYDEVQKNVVVNTPTADLLTSQLVIGKLDAAVVYQANAMQVLDDADIVPLDLEGSVATQTVAIGQDTKYPLLAERLNDALKTAESQESFTSSGFQWLVSDATP